MSLRKGFTCDCGERVHYPGYVYAHWDIPLIYTCEKCGQQWAIIHGVNKRLKKEKTYACRRCQWSGRRDQLVARCELHDVDHPKCPRCGSHMVHQETKNPPLRLRRSG